MAVATQGFIRLALDGCGESYRLELVNCNACRLFKCPALKGVLVRELRCCCETSI